MTAATFPDQRTAPLSVEEWDALALLCCMGKAPMSITVLLYVPDSLHVGLHLLWARGWTRQRRARWELTRRGLREAVTHAGVMSTWLWGHLLTRWMGAQRSAATAAPDKARRKQK